MYSHNLKYLLAVALAASFPASAQSIGQLQQENAQLKAQLQALQMQCAPGSTTGPGWAADGLEASIETLRVGLDKHKDALIAVMVRLHNSSAVPMVVNYQYGSFILVDEYGYQYSVHKIGGSTKGIPTANSRVDTSAIIAPGQSRSVTFTAARDMDRGQTPGQRFDLNATFGQFEDLGQGRVRKVREFPVSFTNIPASGRGTAPANAGNRASGILEQAAGKLFESLVD